MGLSQFEECSSPPRYCSPSIDRSLTKRLIELSTSPSKISSRFAHTAEWVEGLNQWAPTDISTSKNYFSPRHLHFHAEIGLYLPRYEKPNSAPTSFKTLPMNSKMTTMNLAPERIQQLLRKEKELLVELNLSDEQQTIAENHLSTMTQNNSREGQWATFL